jgi:malate dehydrogenase (oxaloacetate-decarboxylating)
MDEWEVFPREAAAVGMKAIEQGIATETMTRDELYMVSEGIIREAREEVKILMREGVIKGIEKEF